MEKFKKFIPFIVAVILFGLGAFFVVRNNRLVQDCTEPATATVVSMREDLDATSSDGIRYLYYPIIEYVVGENTLTATLDSGSNPPAYRIGETFDILYNPANASEFIVAGSNQAIVWIILFALGGVLLIAGIYLLVKK